jgi:hypothetical protein
MNSHQQPIIRGSGHSHNAPFNIDLDVVLQLGRIEDADLPDDELRKTLSFTVPLPLSFSPHT